MTGYCPDCGNTLCICEMVAADEKRAAGFAALETTIATALCGLYGLPVDPPPGELDGIMAARYERVEAQTRVVCEAIITQGEIRPAPRLVYGDDDGSVPTVWGVWFPLAGRGEP